MWCSFHNVATVLKIGVLRENVLLDQPGFVTNFWERMTGYCKANIHEKTERKLVNAAQKGARATASTQLLTAVSSAGMRAEWGKMTPPSWMILFGQNDILNHHHLDRDIFLCFRKLIELQVTLPFKKQYGIF